MLVVVDACVLYPPSLRDLLLTLAALDAFDVCWSETILDELSRNVLADSPQLDPVHFHDHTLGEMRRSDVPSQGVVPAKAAGPEGRRRLGWLSC